MWAWRAVRVVQWSCEWAFVVAEAFHVKCARCGEGGGRCCAALGPRRRGGCAGASAPKSAWVCEEREGAKERAEEGGRGHFYPKVRTFFQ